jgi:hypothetical protein
VQALRKLVTVDLCKSDIEQPHIGAEALDTAERLLRR